MNLGQVIANALRPSGQTPTRAVAPVERADAPQRSKPSGVSVTLTPEARAHISQLEGFAATIGAPSKPRNTGNPGTRLDLRT